MFSVDSQLQVGRCRNGKSTLLHAKLPSSLFLFPHTFLINPCFSFSNLGAPFCTTINYHRPNTLQVQPPNTRFQLLTLQNLTFCKFKLHLQFDLLFALTYLSLKSIPNGNGIIFDAHSNQLACHHHFRIAFSNKAKAFAIQKACSFPFRA